MHVESKHLKYIGTYPFQAPETLGHTTYTKVGTIFHASAIYVSTFFGTTTIPPRYLPTYIQTVVTRRPIPPKYFENIL